MNAAHLDILPKVSDALPLTVRRHALVPRIRRGFSRCGLGLKSSDDAGHARTVPLIIGVSGGADSVALLIAAVAMSGQKSRRIANRSRARLAPIAVHVHHHLRESADDDAAWVKDLCERLGVPFQLEHVYPADLAGNVAANARRLRYKALQRTAHRMNATFIAVAHHADDQLETMLMALCRGTGLSGLRGMPWRRPLNESVTLIRPLLQVRKSECQDLCRVAGIEWREDPSNADIKRVRARLRHDVLPVLNDLWPQAARRVQSTADLIETAQAALARQLEQAFGPAHQRTWERTHLADLPASIVAAGLRRAALEAAPSIADYLSQRHVSEAAAVITSDDRRPHHFDWPGELRLRVTSKRVALAVKHDRSHNDGTVHNG